MTFAEQIKALHPDFNGGDASKVPEFVALIKARRDAPRVCECGCGEIIKRRSNAKPRYRFYSMACWLRYNHGINPRRKLA